MTSKVCLLRSRALTRFSIARVFTEQKLLQARACRDANYHLLNRRSRKSHSLPSIVPAASGPKNAERVSSSLHCLCRSPQHPRRRQRSACSARGRHRGLLRNDIRSRRCRGVGNRGARRRGRPSRRSNTPSSRRPTRTTTIARTSRRGMPKSRRSSRRGAKASEAWASPTPRSDGSRGACPRS